ncbi:hypothetical protein EIN_132450, partial [Entamoeba invadens IP1]
MLFLISTLVFCLCSAEYDTCGTAHEITLTDLDINKEAVFNGDTSTQTPFCWVCDARYGCGSSPPRSYFYKFTLNSAIDIDISTCNWGTGFNTRIGVLTECGSSRAHTCVASNDDDFDDTTCEGGKAHVVLRALAGQTYYVVVSGTTSEDVGNFQVVFKKHQNPYSNICSVAKEVFLPSVVTGRLDKTMAVTTPLSDGQQHYGTWFKYTPAANTLGFIDTCGDYTSEFDPEIYVYTSTDGCYHLQEVYYDDNSCGGMNPRIVGNFSSNYEYYVLLLLKDGVGGQYKLNFRDSPTENGKCTGAVSISSLPFKVTMPLSKFVAEPQTCTENIVPGMWYSIVGDGGDYVMDTCD